jgi:hypothetical protein
MKNNSQCIAQEKTRDMDCDIDDIQSQGVPTRFVRFFQHS